MAAIQGQISELGGFVDKRRSPASGHARNTTVLSNVINYTDRNAMEARLLTASYAQATLNQMTMNDLVYALRLVTDAAGI